MVIDYLVNHGFIEATLVHDIMMDYSVNTKKLISIEIVENLTLRYLEALQMDDPSSIAKTKLTSLPAILSPFPALGPSLWKLPSWDHVMWAIHSMVPVFSQNLESFNSISNAVKIYCLWLKNPQSRPIGVDEQHLEDFVTSILFSFVELFEQRRGNDVKSASILKKHSELCQTVLETIIYDLIPNSPLFTKKSTIIWELLARILLGMTDNLLWSDKANYLADDLSEILLDSLFFVFLESGIYSDEIWNKFKSCFQLWCHRLKSVLVWGNVAVALNSKIASILYEDPEKSESDSQIYEIKFGMHLNQYTVKLNIKYANYCWSRLNNFLPKVSDLSGDIFLRALQSYEKIINTWLSAGETTSQTFSDSLIDRKIPNANILFEIYGEAIFEASLIEKTSHDQGRAIAIAIICKIISKWQYRENISDKYLSISCACLQSALSGDILAAATAVYQIEPVLSSGQIGILSLVVPVFGAVLRFIPKSTTIKSPLPGVTLDALRMCCYRLLSLIYCYFDNVDNPLSSKLILDLSSYGGSFKYIETVQSSPTFACFAPSLKNHLIFLKATLLDTLLACLLIEDSPTNIRFLLNSVSTLLFSNYLEFPKLFPFLVSKFEEYLIKPPSNWTNSLIETQITIARILEQWSRLSSLSSSDSIRLCTSLINMIVGLYAKFNLPLYFRLIISIYETIFSWLSISGSPFVCVSSFISVLVKFMNHDVMPRTALMSPSNTRTSQSPQASISPSVYGIKTHKSLSERVFTLELGNNDIRPSTLSPTLLKGVDEIFSEYTDSILQRLIGFLLQDQINSNYPVELVSTISGLENSANVKYFTLSSSIIIGFTDELIFIRNSIGKFTWSYEYKVSNCTSNDQDTIIDRSPVNLDICSEKTLIPFSRQIVVTEPENIFDECEIILNESEWVKSLENNKVIADKIRPMLRDVEYHVENEIIPSIPVKSRINRIYPQASLPIDTPQIISRLLLTHFGFLGTSTHALVGTLNPSDTLLEDFKKLDELPSRETITIPTYFIGSIDGESVSKSFEYFAAELGEYNETGACPIYADTSLHVTFPISLYSLASSSTTSSSSFNESISIIWSEDSEILASLPTSSSNFIHFLISPILIGGMKGQFFRIRILMARSLQAEYHSIQSIYNSFGPILDGMIVKKSVLSRMIRETSILAHRFISHFIQNSPNPIMKRQMMLKSIIFKNYQANTHGSLIKNIM